MAKTYDIVIFGAYGFTGRLTVDYFAQHVDQKATSWAIAGRKEAELNKVKEEVVKAHPNLKDLPVLVADTADEKSLDALTKATTVLVDLVGPYTLYGEPVVKACIQNKTHYVDITGEANFVTLMRKKYEQQAKEAGVAIINSSGFDSVPMDAGALFTIHKVNPKPERIQTIFQASGRASSGTLASALEIASNFSPSRDIPELVHGWFGAGRESLLSAVLVFLKNLVASLRHRAVKVFPHYHADLKKWVIPMPTCDPVHVRRTADHLPEEFGPKFQTAHYVAVPFLGFFLALLLSPLVIPFFILVRFAAFKNFLARRLEKGGGPSAEVRAKSWFKVSVVGRTAEGRTVSILEVTGKDPGYDETSKILSEVALIVSGLAKKNEVKQTGIVTPAAVCGRALYENLEKAGIGFKLVEEKPKAQ